jgi:hypothetical protein
MLNLTSVRILVLACAASLGLVLSIVPLAAQATMKSPQQVMNALATFPRTVLHTQILINAKNYARLPHENGEVKEGTEALEKSIADEPAGFKAKVEPLLKKADADSEAIADAANTHDDAKLASAHAAYENSVKLLLAAFPASVQPPLPKPPKS